MRRPTGGLDGGLTAAGVAAGGFSIGSRPGFSSSSSHFSRSTLASATWPSSSSAGLFERASEPVAVSSPIPILKSVMATRSGDTSTPPSKAKRPMTEESKAGLSCPVTVTRAAMKSVNRPVATERWPAIRPSAPNPDQRPAKSSLPLASSSLTVTSLPLSVRCPTLRSSFRGRPFTVAVPAMA